MQNLTRDKPYWVGFNVFQGIGPGIFGRLVKVFGSAERAWKAPKEELKPILGKALWEMFKGFREGFEPEKYIREIYRTGAIREIGGIRVLISAEEAYPERLREIGKSPPVLYVLGHAAVLQKPQFAVVGTRKMTDYGARVARELVAGLVEAGLVIVSGLAFGIDTVAHTTALREGGETVAVLGSGVDICSPPDHQKVYEEIVKQGAVVSEIPPGVGTPSKGIFTARNRIISGLSMGVLVVEGAAKSGTLITAGHAKKQGRKIFAVPGPITSRYSDGPNQLIQEGAKAVRRVEDILEELKGQLKGQRYKGTEDIEGIEGRGVGKGLSRAKLLIMAELGDGERRVVEVLQKSGAEGVHVDNLVRKVGLDVEEVGSILSMLEVKGIVVTSRDGKYGLK